MNNNKKIKELRGIRNDFRKVDYQEYEQSFNEKLKQDFVEGGLGKDTPIETLRGLMYGYTFTEDYANCFTSSPFSINYWMDLFYDENYTGPYPIQIKQITDTLLSTGDGRTPETAFCVIDVYQEYELMQEIFSNHVPNRIKQTLFKSQIDCIEFEPNVFGVDKLYFDVHRRFDVGYPMYNGSFDDAEWEILEDDELFDFHDKD